MGSTVFSEWIKEVDLLTVQLPVAGSLLKILLLNIQYNGGIRPVEKIGNNYPYPFARACRAASRTNC